MSLLPNTLPPGETVRRYLNELAPGRRGWMLAYLEQRAIRVSDLEILREIRAYQRQAESRK